MKPLTFSIWGSCVSRDMFKHAAPDAIIDVYLARQSFISTGNTVAQPEIPHGLTSRFQSRLLEGDFSGHALQTLISAQPEVLILDLVDERLGVLPQENGYITRSKELLSSTWWDSVKMSRWIQFGTKEHFSLWKPQAHAVIDQIKTELPHTKVFVFDVPFALRDSHGERTQHSLGRKAKSWNRRYRKYFQEISGHFNIISLPLSAAIAQRSHEWGPAPFHYIDSTYEAMYNELLKRLN